MTTKLKRKLLASQLTQKINERKETALRKVVSDFFIKQMNLVLAAFDEYYNDTMLLQGHINLILAPVHEMTREYYEMLLEHNTGMFRRGEAQAERLVENARQQYSMKAAKPVQFLHDNENKYTQHFGTLQFSEDHLTNYTFTASDKTMNRVDSEINKILTEGYREGWGVRDVRNRIMERYDQFSSWEANRIARTEMQTAHNMGMMNKYSEMGVEYKEWRAAHDKRTRRSHSLLDGEIVPLDKPFSNGLMFPGDKSGKIEEWINCRCSAVPYLMSPGTQAPVGQSQFRADDLVSVTEPNYGKLLQKETGGALNWQQYKQLLHGKSLEEVGVAIAQAKAKEPELDVDIDNILEDIMGEYGLSEKPKTPKKPKAKPKPKEPEIKVIKEPKPKIDVDIDKIMQDALRDAGISTKPKKKTKPKSKPKPKKQEPIEVSLEEHLRNNLPKELGDEAINYIADRVRKRGTVKYEYGQIFDYSTGKRHSPEFKGGKGSVHIKEEDWIKPKNQMTMEELMDAISNPQKYKKSYIKNSNSLASQHNHPPDGCRAPSGADFYQQLISEWEDYSFQISEHEVWCIEYKGSINMIDAKTIEKDCDKLFKKSKRQADKTLINEYDHLDYKEKTKIREELIKEYYGENLLKYIKKNPYGIKVYQVVF